MVQPSRTWFNLAAFFIIILKVENVISNSILNCSCTHLTSFAGGYLVPPHKIKFEKVYYELRSPDEPGKFLVLGTVLTCFLLYLVAVIMARKADSRDKAKVIQLRIHAW